MGPYQFHVDRQGDRGRATGRRASPAPRPLVVQSLNGLLYPPMHLQSFVALAVKEKAPFTLAIKMDPPEGVPGGHGQGHHHGDARAGFDDEITLEPPTGLPPTIPVPKTVPAIAKGKTEIDLPARPERQDAGRRILRPGNGEDEVPGQGSRRRRPPLVLVLGLPFDLKVEPAVVSLNPGTRPR